MKKETIIATAFLVFGLLLEGFYFADLNLFFKAKFWLIGVIFIVIGAIGLWIYTFLPMLEEDNDEK